MLLVKRSRVLRLMRRTAAQESSDNIPPELVGEAKAKTNKPIRLNKTTDTSKIDADKKLQKQNAKQNRQESS